jgi:hypothetical protein
MKQEKKRVHQKLNTEELYCYLKENDKKRSDVGIRNKKYACDCKGKYCDGFPVLIHSVLFEKISYLEKLSQGPIKIVSGVRCEIQNIKTDGSEHSFHLLGRAVDIVSDQLSLDALATLAESIDLLVIRDYDNGVIHCQWNEG